MKIKGMFYVTCSLLLCVVYFVIWIGYICAILIYALIGIIIGSLARHAKIHESNNNRKLR